MKPWKCEVALFGFACFTLGLGTPLLLVDPDGLIGAAMALCAIVAAVEWMLVTHTAD